MKSVFKDVNGNTINVVKHTLDILNKNQDVEIHIGTDSQNRKRKTTYSTVIAYKFGTRGVHLINTRVHVPKIKDIEERLRKETYLTMEVAMWLQEKIPSIKLQIDMDYNGDAKHLSNKVVDQMKGWAVGVGFKVNIKPYSQIATKAADHFCR